MCQPAGESRSDPAAVTILTPRHHPILPGQGTAYEPHRPNMPLGGNTVLYTTRMVEPLRWAPAESEYPSTTKDYMLDAAVPGRPNNSNSVPAMFPNTSYIMTQGRVNAAPMASGVF